MDETKRAVLVTGGALRIGAALCRRFAEEGRTVLIHHRRSASAAEALAQDIRALGGTAHTLGADLAKETEIESLIDRALGRASNLGVLVNCASVFEIDQPDLPNGREWLEATLVNAYAPARLAADLHRAVEGGIVINILDQKLENPNPDYFSYTASKAALAEASRMQAMAFSPRTRVYCVYPGLTLPSGDQTEEEHQRSSTLNLLQRATTPADLAEAALLLASGALKSGERILVDGGQHLTPQARDVMFLIRDGAAL